METEDIKNIVLLYTIDKNSLRQIAIKYNTNHKKIGRILKNEGVKIIRSNRKIIISDKHKDKISISLKIGYDSGKIKKRTGVKLSKQHVYKNMMVHLKYDVDLDWLMSFEDMRKLKYLNKSISRKRDYTGFDTKLYIKFIEKFYNDDNFNRLYDKWILTNDKYIKPSLDHIKPKSKGGSLIDLDNLRFISWFENRTKMDFDEDEWILIKNKIYEYF